MIGINREFDFAISHLYPNLSSSIDYFFYSKTFGFLLYFNKIDEELKKFIGVFVCNKKNKLYNFYNSHIGTVKSLFSVNFYIFR